MSILIGLKMTSDTGKIPTKGHAGDAGYDLYTSEDCIIMPNSFEDISTNIQAEFPKNIWGRITGRSSTSRTLGLMVIEGIIDSGYRGELFIRVFNPGDELVTISCGQRIAQFIPHHLIDIGWVGVKEFKPTERGTDGFGSTGK